MPGLKHLIECHCYLALYKKDKDIINHSFPVYSKLDDNMNVITKIVKCNNCEALHKVFDIGKSELIPGKDQINSVLRKDDLSLMLPDKISKVLTEYDADISNYDHIIDIIEEKRWNEPVIIKREIIGESESVKVLTIKEDGVSIKLSTETINTTIIGE